MALNIQTFKTRALTALVFVVVMLGGLLLHRWGFVALFVLIHFGCWWEYCKLVEKIHQFTLDKVVRGFFFVLGGILLYYAIFPNYSFDIGKTIGGVRIWFKYPFLGFLALCLVLLLIQNKLIPKKAKWLLLAGFAYITLPCALMIAMPSVIAVAADTTMDYHWMDGALQTEYFHQFIIIPCGIIFSIWINDTMAYIVGSLIGKTPFSSISPKKTWEGTGGGAILCVAVIALIGWLTGFLTVGHWMAIAAICAVFGTAGDLLESKLKRLAGVKDSGSFMPGHGGFLDRFDSLLVAVPFVWLYVKCFV
jgi:phosphatidate cytidylyltransferase